MYLLGTSHLVVPDDLSGLFSIIQWLSYVPRVGFVCFYFMSKKICYFNLDLLQY